MEDCFAEANSYRTRPACLRVDQQAALLAEGCFAPGEAKCTYGTGAAGTLAEAVGQLPVEATIDPSIPED